MAHTHVETQGNLIHWASRYDRVVKLMTLGNDGKLRKASAALAQIRPGDAVLDVGCGTGDLTLQAKQLAGSAGKVVGIDAAPEMIEVARAKAARANVNIDFQVQPIERLSFADNTFDIVLSSLMLHHLPGELKHQGLAEVKRVLKPGGRLVVVDAKMPAKRLERLLYGHIIGHMGSGFDEIEPLVRQAGFGEIETGVLSPGVLGYVRAKKA